MASLGAKLYSASSYHPVKYLIKSAEIKQERNSFKNGPQQVHGMVLDDPMNENARGSRRTTCQNFSIICGKSSNLTNTGILC